MLSRSLSLALSVEFAVRLPAGQLRTTKVRHVTCTAYAHVTHVGPLVGSWWYDLVRKN